MVSSLQRFTDHPILFSQLLMTPHNYIFEQRDAAKQQIDKIIQSIDVYKKFELQENHPFQENHPYRLTHREISQLYIRLDDHSELPLFKYDTFEYTYTEGKHNLIRKCNPQYKNLSFEYILLTETTKAVVKVIAWLAISLLTFPFTLCLSLIGQAISSSAKCRKRKVQVKQLELNQRTFDTVGKTARVWQGLALDKELQANKVDDRFLFSDSGTINKLIAQCMERPDRCRLIYDKVFIARDEALNNIQAIALTKEHTLRTKSGDVLGKYLKLSHIVTHPNNIRSEVNKTVYTRVEGAATAIMRHLAEKAVEKDQGIYLESVLSAKGFYEKLGFEELKSQDIRMLEENCVPMHLTAEKIKNLSGNIFC